MCSPREMVVVAVVSAVASLAVGAALGPQALVVIGAGLALSAAYSLRPVRIADRGAFASLLLPACYVAVPYLLGVFAVRPVLTAADLELLAALYVGFIGRILLKDFRDVVGDRLFGKRTFLVRHGRRATCMTSGAFWSLGTVLLATAPHVGAPAALALGAFLVAALVLLASLSVDLGRARDERLIAASAIIGRGMILEVLARLSLTGMHRPELEQIAIVAAIALSMLAQAGDMALNGATTSLTVPLAWFAVEPARAAVEPKPQPALALALAPERAPVGAPAVPGRLERWGARAAVGTSR
jgi:hypothetical protein